MHRRVIVGFSHPRAKFSPVSWLIRLFEGTRFSHAYLKLEREVGDEGFLPSVGSYYYYHADGSSVTFLGPKAFEANHRSLKEFPFEASDETYSEIMRFCTKNVGKGYSYKQAIGIGIVKILSWLGIKIRNPFRNGRANYICSELVAYVFRDYMDVPIEKDLELITPKDIYRICKTLSEK